MAATVSTVALLTAAPFPAHAGHGVAAGTTGGFPLLACVSLYVLVVLAGSLLGPALTRMRTRGWLRPTVVGALGLAYAGLVCAQLVRHELSAAVGAGIVTAVAVAVFALRRDDRIEQALAAVILVAAQAPVVGTGAGWSHLTGVLLHLVAASVWIGGVLHVVTVIAAEGREQGAVAARRFSVYAIGSTACLAGSGVLLMVVHHVDRAVLTSSTYGHVLVAKMAALVAAVGLGFSMRRRASAEPTRSWPRLVRSEAVVLAGALGLGAVLVGLADPVPAYAATAPGLVHVRMGDEFGTVFVVRRDDASGWLLYAAGDDDAPAVQITDGKALRWRPSNDDAQLHAVALRNGVARLAVRYEGHTVHLAVTSTRGAVQPGNTSVNEFVAAALGRSLASALGPSAGSVQPSCAPRAIDQGVAFGVALRRLGIRSARVLADGSARSRDFATGLRHANVNAAPHASAVVLATDADRALRTVPQLSRATGGIYLAPWLLDGTVLSATSTRGLPMVSVAALDDPMSPVADRYRGALAALAPRVAPTAAGLDGFQAVAAPAPGVVFARMYAAAPVGFLPGVVNAGHDHSSATSWFPNGTLAPISPPVRVPRTCTSTQ